LKSYYRPLANRTWVYRAIYSHQAIKEEIEMIYKMKQELYNNLRHGLGYDTKTCRAYKCRLMTHGQIVTWADQQVWPEIKEVQTH